MFSSMKSMCAKNDRDELGNMAAEHSLSAGHITIQGRLKNSKNILEIDHMNYNTYSGM